MGISASAPIDQNIAENRFLKRFCGEEGVEESDDEFWNDFLSFSTALKRDRNAQKDLKYACKASLESLLVNNVSTRNICTLARIVLKRLEKACNDPHFEKDLIRNWQLINGLFILTVISKYFAETLDIVQARVQWYGKERGVRRKSGFATHVLVSLGRNESADGEMDITSASTASLFGKTSASEYVGLTKNDIKLSEGDLGDITALSRKGSKVDDAPTGRGEKNSENESKPGRGSAMSEDDIMDDLLYGLFKGLVSLQRTEFAYPLQLQITNLLICLLSSQLYCSLNTPNYTTEVLMTGKAPTLANDVISFLLKGFIRLVRPIYGLPESVSSTLSYYFSPEWHCFVDIFAFEEGEVSVSNNCLFLILLLTSNVTYTDDYNPFYVSLASFLDSKGKKKSLNVDGEYFDILKLLNEKTPRVSLVDKIADDAESRPLRMSFHDIYDVFCPHSTNEATSLLLYMIINCNPRFAAYVSCRSDPGNIIVPLLKWLAGPSYHSSHSVYIILIILLILSQTDRFNEKLHKSVIEEVGWYKEKPLSTISLGSLTVLILLHTIQKNVSSMKDVYLHTNCLAIMANMSCTMTNLHPQACQKLVNVIMLFFKKFQRYLVLEKESKRESGSESLDDDGPPDSVVFGDFMRLMLQVISNALNCNLGSNPHLVYTLLYQKEVFIEMAKYPTFSELASSISKILVFFNNNVEKDKKNSWMYTYDDVISSIKDASKSFPAENLKPNRQMKFMYEEEQFPEEFFIPYAWSLVFHKGSTCFEESRLTLISPTYPLDKSVNDEAELP